jgi:hypothetical protein
MYIVSVASSGAKPIHLCCLQDIIWYHNRTWFWAKSYLPDKGLYSLIKTIHKTKEGQTQHTSCKVQNGAGVIITIST